MIPLVLGRYQVIDQTGPVSKASFTSLPRAMYSASGVDDAAQLCELLAKLTAAPPRTTDVPDIEACH